MSSLEALVLGSMVEEGTLKKGFQHGLTREDFQMHEEEWDWLFEQMERKKPINWRRFKKQFPDFERIQGHERLQDLIDELKQESAYFKIASAIEEIDTDLTPENAIERAGQLREIVSDILRAYSPQSDINLTEEGSIKQYLERQRQLRILREQGIAPGISSGLPNIDHHWGGFMPGRLVVVLGRPGDAKSMTQAKFFIEAFKQGENVAMFSPEMNEDEHRARVATLLSADPVIQEMAGLKKAFRNRALMEGHGYNEKSYKRFWHFLETEMPGQMILFTQRYRRTKMTPAYIESKIDDLNLGMVFVDPIYKLKPNVKRSDRRAEVEECVDEIQDLAESFNIPIVISNQAGRALGTKGRPPDKDSSHNSDAPVQEADHVIGVKYFSETNTLRIHCSKNRFGGDFTFDCKFFPNIGILEDKTPLTGNYFTGFDESSVSEDTLALADQAMEIDGNQVK